MTWEEKVEMIQLSNQANDRESRKKFLEYVLKHIEKFDKQAYDMFINGLSLLPDEMKEDTEYHKQIFPYIKKELENGNQGLRTSLRLAMYVSIFEKEVNLNITK